METRTVPAAASVYAAKFGVALSIEKFGIFGDEWDWVARPVQPTHYPAVRMRRNPVATDYREVVRPVAAAMGTGRWNHNRFKVVKDNVNAGAL